MTYVAYCIPSGDIWKADTAFTFGGLCAYSASKGVETCIMNQRVCSVAHSRNMHVFDLLKMTDPRVTHFMWIDSDMSFPTRGLEQLLKHDKDMVGAFYPQKAHPFHVVGSLVDPEDAGKGGLRRAAVIGGGFVLVKREVYERLECPWYEERYGKNPDGSPGLVSDDVFFSWRCRDAGIEMWVDLDLSREMGHSGNNLVRFSGGS